MRVRFSKDNLSMSVEVHARSLYYVLIIADVVCLYRHSECRVMA
jgi:hypothetical protein